MTEEEFIDKLNLIREARNNALKDTDWTQIPDSTVDKQAWADYRQALRDLPSLVTEENIDSLEFPLPPQS